MQVCCPPFVALLEKLRQNLPCLAWAEAVNKDLIFTAPLQILQPCSPERCDSQHQVPWELLALYTSDFPHSSR
jgi:hypothetical protein